MSKEKNDLENVENVETNAVGKEFEELTENEMIDVQGAGDIEGEAVSLAAIAVSFSLSLTVVKTLKSKC